MLMHYWVIKKWNI